MIGLSFLIITSIVFGMILYYLDKNKENTWKYTFFSCIFVTYPLITEFFGFFEALTIPVQFTVINLVLFYEIIKEKNTVLDIIAEGVIFSFVTSGYESLIFAYITEVLIFLFIKYVKNNKEDYSFVSFIKDGMNYAYCLFLALILKYVIGHLILMFTGLELVSLEEIYI